MKWDKIFDLIKTLLELFRMNLLLFFSAFFAIFFALILFGLPVVLPDKFLQKYQIDSLIKKHQGLIFLLFLFFFLLFLFLLGRIITKKFIEKRNKNRKTRSLNKVLQELNSQEKDFLSYYIEFETREQQIPIEENSDIKISRLLSKRIIQSQPNYTFIINLSAYEVLDKNRELLEPELSSRSRQKFKFNPDY